jgi:diphosphomevalonate decarboxylase
MSGKKTARAHSNIALVKYWGKNQESLNTPAVGSISLTLDSLFTTTSVEFDETLTSDIILFDGSPAPANVSRRLSAFLDLIRQKANFNRSARVETVNNFPTAAGLASSASGFAALALASSAAAGLELSSLELSLLARRGSGSAARSVYGGYVEMNAGQNPDGSDSYAVQLYPESYWDLQMFIAVLSEQEKPVRSTEGMNRTRYTSPYYHAWVDTSHQDLADMRDALKRQDFRKVGEITEQSCLKMHAVAMSAHPGIIYWHPETLRIIHQVRQLRQDGIEAYFTIDAGPQVKVLCRAADATRIEKILNHEPAVSRVISCNAGPGAHLIE